MTTVGVKFGSFFVDLKYFVFQLVLCAFSIKLTRKASSKGMFSVQIEPMCTVSFNRVVLYCTLSVSPKVCDKHVRYIFL